jgi:hypothetical protein
MTIEEKKARVSQLRRGKKNFEQSLLLSAAATCFVIYEIYQAATKDSPPWFFFVLMGAIAATLAGIAVWNYRKSKRASAEAESLIAEIKAENPDEHIQEDTDQRRFF